MKYVFLKKCADGSEFLKIIDDPLKLFKLGEYDEEAGDKIFQLGSEIKIEINLKVKSNTRSTQPLDTDYRFGLKTESGYNG